MLASEAASIREKANWCIHLRYLRQEYTECMALIEQQLRASNGLCEYALYVKGLILRIQGDLDGALNNFQACTMISPQSVLNLKQVGRTMFLLGKHKQALDIYEEAKQFTEEDWELEHNAGLCHMFLKNYEKAEECFVRANVIQRHDSTFKQLAKLYTQQEKYNEAIDTHIEALEFSPENPELLTSLGLLFLRTGDNNRAFDYLGSALTIDPRNPKTILAAGSILQDNQDWDVALSKYRVVAVQSPNNAQLWNNVGMCFFGKQNYIAAISCLRRAMYLAPFEWIIAYNLGLVFMHTEQYASAFHYLSASINLKPDYALCFMHLAIALNRLDDFENSCMAYEKAISMEQDHIMELNYAVTLFNNEVFDKAREHFSAFEKLFEELDEESQNADPEVLKVRDQLAASLYQ